MQKAFVVIFLFVCFSDKYYDPLMERNSLKTLSPFDNEKPHFHAGVLLPNISDILIIHII